MTKISTPEQFLGFRVGADRKLADWPQIVEYFERVDNLSDRVKVERLGETTEGNSFILATISSPENLRNLERLRELQMRLCNPSGLTEVEERRLLEEGKIIVLITCSIHSTEVGGSQMSMELLHKLATEDSPEVREILDNVVLLLVPSLNPDGNRIVVKWYKETLGSEWEGTRPPFLYHKYAGHDNNRDWFMFSLKETRLLVEKVHNRWHPQIIYDIHQMGQKGPRFFLPPYIDPIDGNVDPVIQAEIALMGLSMASQLILEGRRGVVWHWVFDGWTPARAYQHYHGGIRILSEAASVDIASPVEVKREELESERGLDPKEQRWNNPMPWMGGEWTLRDIVDYEFSAAMACLRNSAKYRESWLRGSLEIGRRALKPESGPYAFIIPPGQRDPGAVAELLQVLKIGDVEVKRSKSSFIADGVEYGAGTYVVLFAQPYGRFAKTMLELQQYPDLRESKEEPPVVPYDVTAHTLGLQMGVEVHQVEDAFEADLEDLENPILPAGSVYGRGKAYYLFPPEMNNSAKAANSLMRSGYKVFRIPGEVELEGVKMRPGGFAVEVGGRSEAPLEALARELGVSFHGVDKLPEEAYELRYPRVGVYRAWVPNPDEGWLRLVLENYYFPYETLTPQDVRRGGLADRIDVLIFPDLSRDIIVSGMKGFKWLDPDRYPPKYRAGLGRLGTEEVLKFLRAGGTVIALNRACDFPIKDLWVPAENCLEGLSEKEFYIPGSILRVLVDNSHPLGYGYDREEAIMFLRGPAFKVKEGRVVVRYPETNPLLSGWILGDKHLHGRAAAAEIPTGKGKVILLGFPPHFRNQTRGTFKILFNAIFYGSLRN